MTDHLQGITALYTLQGPVRSPSDIPVEEFLNAALALGQAGLQEDVAVPNPNGGYIVVTRDILGPKS